MIPLKDNIPNERFPFVTVALVLINVVAYLLSIRHVIFEEFKGTGNAELRLTRELADRRVYPAVDIAASGTRREELLADPAAVEAKQKLRRNLVGLPPEKAMEVLLTELRRFKTNAEVLKAVR